MCAWMHPGKDWTFRTAKAHPQLARDYRPEFSNDSSAAHDSDVWNTHVGEIVVTVIPEAPDGAAHEPVRIYALN